ncbi:MAG TPA: BON domain-containing protein [Longimicrobiales bacterium]
MAREEKKLSSTAVKIGIAGAVAFGAVVSGFLASRQGRRFVKDVWQGRRRTPLEDRALDTIWGDRMLGRRHIDVQEIEPGVLALMGQVRSADERRWARALVARINGVNEIEDRLLIVGRAR